VAKQFQPRGGCIAGRRTQPAGDLDRRYGGKKTYAHWSRNVIADEIPEKQYASQNFAALLLREYLPRHHSTSHEINCNAVVAYGRRRSNR
jgi:hypothetical protein